ncbi:MAG TPA: hypothetical protein V6C71_27080 [Coleofasciculaceae cyanobacterium]|jgi:hypothetical protein
MGRQTKLTETVKQTIIDNIEQGLNYESACLGANVSYSTFREWMRRGTDTDSNRQSNELYAEFAEDVNRAVATSEINLIRSINQAAKTDWKAAAWILERRFPQHWSNSRKIKQEADKKVQQLLSNLFWLLPTDSYQELLKALSQIDSIDLNLSQMSQMEALKILMESGWIEKEHSAKIGKAYLEMKKEIISSIN